MEWRDLAVALSGSVVCLSVLLAALAWRDARALLQGRVLALLGISVAALEVCTGPIGQSRPAPVWVGLRLAGAFNVALLWLFCVAILRDDLRLGQREWVVLAVLSFGPIWTMIDPPRFPARSAIDLFAEILPLAAIAHIGWIAVAERGDDLVEGRLRARFWLPVLLVTLAFLSVASEFLGDPVMATLARTAAAGLPALLILAFWMMTLDPRRLQFEPATKQEPARPAIDPRDRALLGALQEAMEQGLYREPGLTIETLAEQLSTPAHRLRALINQGLGHRNFAAYVNKHRVAHAKSVLADPARGRDAILAIAFESGFGALQSFNRVFKEAEGETPREFRTKRLAETAQNQKSPPIS